MEATDSWTATVAGWPASPDPPDDCERAVAATVPMAAATAPAATSTPAVRTALPILDAFRVRAGAVALVLPEVAQVGEVFFVADVPEMPAVQFRP